MPSQLNKSRKKESEPFALKRILISSAIGSALFFLIISLFSLAVLKSDMFSSSSYIVFGIVSAAFSAFLCGFITVRPVRKNGISNGALSGIVQTLICAALIFFINENKSGVGIFILMAVTVVFSSVGGVSAVNLKVKKRY